LVGLLHPRIGRSEYYIKNKEAFINKLCNITLQETDILTSFDMVSLFTKVPLEDTLQILSQNFDNQIIALIRQVLITIYFLYSGSFYDQRDGIAMGSPLISVTATFCMEFLKQQAITLAAKKPARWHR
jgi:hypothetical protein